MGKRIVEKSIKKMDAPEHGNRIEWDSEIPGFGVRVDKSFAPCCSFPSPTRPTNSAHGFCVSTLSTNKLA
jgi:hypothetical protein